jgi:hypothetical protein
VSEVSRPFLGSTQILIQWVPVFRGGVGGDIVPRLRICGALSPLFLDIRLPGVDNENFTFYPYFYAVLPAW